MTEKKKPIKSKQIKEIIEKSDVPPSGQRIPMPSVKPPAKQATENTNKPKKTSD
jgi:hypothetical protein